MSTATGSSTCIVCGGEGDIDRALDGLVWRCVVCSFTWTAAAIAAPEAIHGESYFRGGGYEDYFVPSARRFEARVRLHWLLSLARPTTLLEVGCAAGFFVEAATRAGIAAEGMEVSEIAAQYARDELGMPVRQERFETARFPTTFAAVCAFHVLEHVEDPRVFLDAVWHVLAPNGLLLLEVPNIDASGARRLGSAWPGLQPEYHRWHFSPATLERLVADRGFEILQRDTAAFRLYMPPRYRRRHAHHLLPADVRDLGSLRLTHPTRGDLLRLAARRRPDDASAAA